MVADFSAATNWADSAAAAVLASLAARRRDSRARARSSRRTCSLIREPVKEDAYHIRKFSFLLHTF
jgi:hypothetical protein